MLAATLTLDKSALASPAHCFGDCQTEELLGRKELAVAYKADAHRICDSVSKLLATLPKEMKIIYNNASRRIHRRLLHNSSRTDTAQGPPVRPQINKPARVHNRILFSDNS